MTTPHTRKLVKYSAHYLMCNSTICPATKPKRFLPSRGEWDTLPSRGEWDTLPLRGERSILPLHGERSTLPLRGERSTLPLRGERSILPVDVTPADKSPNGELVHFPQTKTNELMQFMVGADYAGTDDIYYEGMTDRLEDVRKATSAEDATLDGSAETALAAFKKLHQLLARDNANGTVYKVMTGLAGTSRLYPLTGTNKRHLFVNNGDVDPIKRGQLRAYTATKTKGRLLCCAFLFMYCCRCGLSLAFNATGSFCALQRKSTSQPRVSHEQTGFQEHIYSCNILSTSKTTALFSFCCLACDEFNSVTFYQRPKLLRHFLFASSLTAKARMCRTPRTK
jgi:hypothetical protein